MCPRTDKRRSGPLAKPPPAAMALLCCLLLLLPAALPAADTAAPADPFADAKALYTAAEYQKALDAYIALIDTAPDDATRAEYTLWQAHCLSRLGRADEATAAYQKTHELAGDTLIGVQTLEYLAALHISKGDYEQAEQFLDQAIKAYPDAYTAYLEAAGSTRYVHNRGELDVAIEHSISQLTTLANSLKAGGQTQAAALIYRKLAIEHPYRHGWPARNLQAADLLRETGAQAAAIPFYLRVLSAAGDRAYTPKAITSHNQPHLDAVCAPVPPDTVKQAVVGLNACMPEQYRLSDEQLAQFSSAWHAALALTFEPFGQPWRTAWPAIMDAYPRPWSMLATIAQADCLVRDGDCAEAIELLSALQVDADAFPAIAQHRYHGLSRAHLGLREFDLAFEKPVFLFGPDPVIASEAMLNEAAAAEFQGDFDNARRLYTRAERASKVLWHRRQAEIAGKRVASYKPYRSRGGTVFVLPDDRTTRGDWYLGYGTAFYALSAQNFLVDRTGGPGPKLNYDFRTTDPNEPSRLWVTATEGTDPASIWDPHNRTHRPANRDDYGEQYPIGAGPDLLCDVEVPAGAHLLSFYFVNDHNYYEPNREYTITVESETETLAVTDVRQLGGGVYKRFAVRSPQTLTVHIWRNASMNTLLSGMFLDTIAPLHGEPPGSAGSQPAAAGRAPRPAAVEEAARLGAAPLSGPPSASRREPNLRGQRVGTSRSGGLVTGAGGTERGHIANLEFPAAQSASDRENGELKIRDVTPVAPTTAGTPDAGRPPSASTPGAPPGGPPLPTLPAEMLALRARLNRAIEADPARAATYTDRFRELADALRPLTAQTDSPAAAWWTLTECHHAQGRFRAADAAFDAYLAALRNVYEPSELPDAYAAVARNLIGPDRNGSATVTGLIRLHTFADGAHPADRAWQACLAALVELHAAAPDEHETALCAIVKDRDIRCTPYAKRSAYAVLEQQFPAAASRPDVASAAARAFARSDTEKATTLLTGALAASPSDAEKPSILFNLLMEQSKSTEMLEQAQATYDQLAPYASDRKYASLTRTGLWHLADLYHRAGKPETALALVQQYVSTYGSDSRIEALSARVRAEKP